MRIAVFGFVFGSNNRAGRKRWWKRHERTGFQVTVCSTYVSYRLRHDLSTNELLCMTVVDVLGSFVRSRLLSGELENKGGKKNKDIPNIRTQSERGWCLKDERRGR